MRLQSLLLLGTGFTTAGTPHTKLVLETNISTFVSVGSRTQRVLTKQNRAIVSSIPDPLTACSGQVLPITCFSLYTQSSSYNVIEGPGSSHVEPSSSRVSSTTSATTSGSSTSTAPSTAPFTPPTDPIERQRVCFTGTACSPLFSSLTTLWKGVHADKPIYEQDKEFATVYCELENLKIFTDASSSVIWDCRVCSEANSRATELWDTFLQELRGFCKSPARSVYTLSKQILGFKKDMVLDPLGMEPAGFDPIVQHMVEAWEKQGVNGMASYTSSPTGTKTQSGAAGVLTQLPRAWPYTRAAVARRPGMTARFTVTAKNGEAQVVVVESMVW
ncbi:uncharacterized protein CC84DRAFT_1217993 [Paraphaeosphaeria sporulosa]|uniref:Uncharacterized protein n=1 Tax=Paraphaeosphaeria sporulosa TaxID=1460663 RepID=A0A177CCM0_9PLEO|nr:uncharacterized protein CC84DRAFT_1217993 [Paraphaeosphaeria sporulosa]OAG04549.1 hypothetical protein CC84DRAFT_1217993 [Paraphaeosphaeria sporulosa]